MRAFVQLKPLTLNFLRPILPGYPLSIGTATAALGIWVRKSINPMIFQWRLRHNTAHDWIASAIQRETTLKRWKPDWKIKSIESMNPNWEDLEHKLS